MTEVVALDAALRRAITDVAAVGTLLVAVDVDGTIAEIAARPGDARVLDGALDALRTLAALPRTDVTVLSGRTLDELEDLVPLGAAVTLVGSHGAERGARVELDDQQSALRTLVLDLVETAASGLPGALAEPKATGAALHVRLAAPQAGDELLAQVARAAGDLPGVHARSGKAVLELSVIPAGKGHALDDLRREHGADAVVFVGDDVTDEEALARLGPGDLGVKVGPGATAARARVPDPGTVVALLEALAQDRRWATAASGS